MPPQIRKPSLKFDQQKCRRIMERRVRNSLQMVSCESRTANTGLRTRNRLSAFRGSRDNAMFVREGPPSERQDRVTLRN